MGKRRRWALAPAFACAAAPLRPADIAITIITSSPVQDARLPALRETWLGGAAARCAAALVVSDAAVRCDGGGPCVASVAVDCAASHAGLPCKSARALEASLAAAPRARWHVRVMDDTYVDVDALAWHLGDLDDARPWYVGDTVAVPREGAGRADGATFRVALGGAGWALSGPAAALAAAHLDLYFSLASGMVRASDGGREWALPASRSGRPLFDAGRGMRLDSHIADDVFFGTFMAALGVGAAGPRGFTQAPVDARGGVPPCGPGAAAAAAARGPDDADCGDPQRHHDLGAVWLSDPATGALVEVDDLVAAGSCRRPFARPAVVHLGDEIGGFNNARWRGQFGDLHRALANGTAVFATYEPSPLHYWRLCAVDAARATPRLDAPSAAPAPAPQVLKLVVAGEVREIAVSACDDPAAVGRAFCDAAVGPGGAACREQVAGQAAQVRDALWDHRRPATLAVRFPGDEDPAGWLDVHAGDDPELVAARFCEAHAVDDADCVAVAAAAANLQPPLARAWCPR